MEFLEIEKYTYLDDQHQSYIEELKAYCKESRHLPKHHIYPPCGLLNDPNGLCYFEGKYHVFYQWFPFEPNHGMKHWAHVTSEDLIHWEWSQEMLIPDQEYEKNGCYSGNAIEEDGKVYLFYTANYKTEHGKIPKQALAVMEKDGSIRKYPGNPVIDGAPKGTTGEIRDPFVFKKGDRYYMMLGGEGTDGTGQLLVYKSQDLYIWDYQGSLELGCENLGYMYECPAYMEIDGKDVLLLSLIGVKPNGERYRNEFTTVCFTGKLDLDQLRFETEHMEELDKGFDFYAPQMFRGKDGRPLMFGWFGCGVQELPYSKKDMWQHALTLPRELRIKNGILYQMPAKEVKERFPLLEIKKGECLVPEESTWRFQMETEKKTEIQIGKPDDCLVVTLDPKEGKLTVDRSNLKQKLDESFGTTRSCPVSTDKAVMLEFYYDNTFAEIYVEDGKETMSLRLFPESVEIRVK